MTIEFHVKVTNQNTLSPVPFVVGAVFGELIWLVNHAPELPRALPLLPV